MNSFANSIHRHRGFSLIELMIALVIGLFLMLGVIQIFAGSRLSYQVHEGIGRIQENGRFGIEILSRQIRMAGYRSSFRLSDATVFGVGNRIIDGRNNVAGGGADSVVAGSDKLIIRYQGATDGTTVDCLGNALGGGTTGVMVFMVNANRALHCAVNPGNIDTAVGQPLLEGVTDMQLLFGERTVNVATSPPAEQFRYVTANNVTAWDNVISVRIVLSVDSIQSVDPDLPNGRLVIPYSSTVTIRNRI